ncbi:putative oxidoreductase [[Actinomadura] parvosata subsp. kistnae]|uniref:SDR family NAD(P)-dependent oxidoreductase n=1 Tax=[Actinomadura] parvosata TaxID=1955412 RepID=UPI000D27CE03|nr:putative oxidoreductase [Actinomadura parvosata subsp. kistnae]
MTGKTVLITGATSGIGAHTARLLLDRGHRVAVTGRDETRLKFFLDETGHPDRLLGIIAAAGHPRTIADGDPELWAPMVLTNVLGPACWPTPPCPTSRPPAGG